MVDQQLQPLTQLERQDLERLELVARRGLYDAGRALQEIFERKLYRAVGDWGSYTRRVFGITRGYAYRLIKAVSVRENLGCLQLPQEHAEQLFGLEPAAQQAVYARACVGGAPTTNRIRECRDAYQRGRLDDVKPPLAPRGNGEPLAIAEQLLARLGRIAGRLGVADRAAPLLEEMLAVLQGKARPRAPAEVLGRAELLLGELEHLAADAGLERGGKLHFQQLLSLFRGRAWRAASG